MTTDNIHRKTFEEILNLDTRSDTALRDRNCTQDARQDDNDDAGPVRKHFDERLETIRSRHPELYESIIIEIEAVISKYFG